VTPVGRILREADFLGWLGVAQPGDAVVYHRGCLAIDRGRVSNRGLNRLADRIADAAASGLVDLLQRRHGPDDTSYLAIARRRAIATPATLTSERP